MSGHVHREGDTDGWCYPGHLIVRWKKQELDPNLMPSIDIHSGWNTDLNVKDKTLRYLEEKIFLEFIYLAALRLSYGLKDLQFQHVRPFSCRVKSSVSACGIYYLDQDGTWPPA